MSSHYQAQLGFPLSIFGSSHHPIQTWCNTVHDDDHEKKQGSLSLDSGPRMTETELAWLGRKTIGIQQPVAVGIH